MTYFTSYNNVRKLNLRIKKKKRYLYFFTIYPWFKIFQNWPHFNLIESIIYKWRNQCPPTVWKKDCTVAWLEELQPCSKKGLGFKSRPGVFQHVLPVHAWVPYGYSVWLAHSKNMTARFIDLSRLPLAVSVYMHGCLSCSSLCCAMMHWWLVQHVAQDELWK